MHLSTLLAAVPGIQERPVTDPELTAITDDSRQVQPGALFVAVPGLAVDGHRFIPQAVAAGAGAVVGERPLAPPPTSSTPFSKPPVTTPA